MSMSSSKKSHSDPLFVYPEKVGGVAVTIADFRTLEQEVYLNDVVVDFYMLFLLNHVLSEDQRGSLQSSRVHVLIFQTFDHFFWFKCWR